MRDQPRGGHIFNMDGAGADGNPTPRSVDLWLSSHNLRISVELSK